MACLGRYLYHWIQFFKSLAAIKKNEIKKNQMYEVFRFPKRPIYGICNDFNVHCYSGI